MDKVVNEQGIWTDSRFGSKGYGAWLVPFGWLIALYQLYLISGALGQDELWAIDLFLILFLGSLLIGGVQFFVTALKTAQKIVVKNGGICEISLFYWKQRVLSQNQILSVEPIRLKFYQKLMTPLDRSLDNYKVILKNGGYFYISGATNGVSQLAGEFVAEKLQGGCKLNDVS